MDTMLAPVIVLLLGALLQSTLLPALAIGGVTPDLVLLLVIGWATLRGLDEGTIWGIVGGISLDLFSSAPFGTGLIALGVLGVVAATTNEPLRRLHDWLPLVATPVLTLAYYLVLGLALTAMGRPVEWLSAFWLVVLPALFVNAAWMVPVYLVVRRLDSWLAGDLGPYGRARSGWPS